MELKIENISKSYNRGKKQALNNINITLREGVYGLLGANGAGKSTLMNILTDNIEADSGTITLDRTNILKLGKDFRNILGYVPQQQGIYDDFTAIRFLWYMAALKGMKQKFAKERIEYVLDLVNLKDVAHKKLKSFSGGMKQRILIAQALLNDPKIIILDEPTAGLDPKERIRIRNFISEISIHKIIILATHVVSDIEYIAREIILLKEGEIVMKGSQLDLLKTMDGKVFECIISEETLNDVQSNYKVSNISADNEGLSVRIINNSPPSDLNFKKVKANLEDLYLYSF
ncbi:MAG: ABC transporter ATP-binding protein [Clostridium sp.]|uniref:ABC transporter ATP-binding protein n=1 Tax=Clostridium sp. TaxID=1506 RepID=UPI002FC8E796